MSLIRSAQLSSAQLIVTTPYSCKLGFLIPTNQMRPIDIYIRCSFFAFSTFLISVWVVLKNFVCHTVALMRLSICSKIMQNAHFGQNGGHAQGGLYFDKY